MQTVIALCVLLLSTAYGRVTYILDSDDDVQQCDCAEVDIDEGKWDYDTLITATEGDNDTVLPWCLAVTKTEIVPVTGYYVFSMRVMNIDSIEGPDYGSIGMAFNIQEPQDECPLNFDFVFFRLRDAQCDPPDDGDDGCLGLCVQWGYMEEGMPYMEEDQEPCPYSIDEGLRENHINVRVSDTRVTFHMKLAGEVARWEPYFDAKRVVGIILPGYEQEIQYRVSFISH